MDLEVEAIDAIGAGPNDDTGKSKGYAKITKLKEKLSKTKTELKTEKAAKHKLYKGLVKLASELKETRATCRSLERRVQEEYRMWYQREPQEKC